VQVELAECREKAALGWGRYKHNQQLEELRNLQEQLQAGLRIRIHFIPDPDPALKAEYRSGSRALMTKNWKK
jgi:hypothetical protein